MPKNGGSGLTWSQALGIAIGNDFATIGIPNGRYGNHWLTVTTGCAGYNEPGYPSGTWYAPSRAEAYEMIPYYPVEARLWITENVYYAPPEPGEIVIIGSGHYGGVVYRTEAGRTFSSISKKADTGSYWRCVRTP